MYNTVEYSYDTGNRHLTDDEALDYYKKAKATHPNAIVVLDDLNCGHWDVDICVTDEQKKMFYRRRLEGLYKQLLNRLTK